MDFEARRFQARLAMLMACAAATLGAPGVAAGAVTIGSTTDNFANYDQCSATQSMLQSVNPPGRNYTAPSSGVITSWQHRDGAEAGVPALKLKVYTPVGDPATTTTWNLRSQSPQRSGLTSNALNTIQESPGIPIQAGDHLGLTALGGALHVACLSFTGGGPARRRSNAVDGGADTTIGNNTFNGETADVGVDAAATIEPDADGDLYGDETQDQCATDPTTQGPCQADLAITNAAAPEPVVVGSDLTYTITVTNTSAVNTASSVVVSDTLPSGVTFKSSTGSQGSCAGTTTVSCTLGLLGVAASATVQIVVTPTTAGTLSDTATLASSTPDPNAANNSATATSTVNAPSGGGTGTDGGGGGGGGGTTADVTAPIGLLLGKGKQDVDKLALTVGSNEAAAVHGRATVKLQAGKKPVAAKPVTGNVPAAGTTKLRFRFAKQVLRQIKRALAKGRTVKAQITVKLTDAAGNVVSLKRSIRLKR